MEALEPFIASAGRSFLKYDESEQVMKAATMPGMIKAAHPYLSAMHALDPKLSFKRTQVRSVIKMLLAKYGASWKLSGPLAEDYAVTLERRMCNIHHVVPSACAKTSRPSWANELPWENGGTGNPQEEEVQGQGDGTCRRR